MTAICYVTTVYVSDTSFTGHIGVIFLRLVVLLCSVRLSRMAALRPFCSLMVMMGRIFYLPFPQELLVLKGHLNWIKEISRNGHDNAELEIYGRLFMVGFERTEEDLTYN